MVAVDLMGGIGELVATLLMTILVFVLAEVSPKTYVAQYTDRVALRLAPLVVALGRAWDRWPAASSRWRTSSFPARGCQRGPS